MARSSLETLRARIERYRGVDPDDATYPTTARLGARFLAGHELATADAVALGRTGSLLGVMARDFERAGYWVRTRRTKGNAVVYWLHDGPDARPRDTPAPPRAGRATSPPRKARRESPHGLHTPSTSNNGHAAPRPEGAEVDYPRLGAVVLVSALAILPDGEVVVHLRADDGAVWQAHVVGYVAPP